ncbi:MAG: ribosomal protein S18-alanine N-acetyltransferase [Streptococcaceae bacterium]|jgi:ribosomal-protein-alanine N-acetyltransferase|nr:ribosomal protein S18-alanine N-acetyltransferase [Streptococcaceae bacterium]
MIGLKKFKKESLEQLDIPCELIEKKELSYCICKAKVRDIKALLAIEKDVYHGDAPWTYSHFFSEIRLNKHALFFVIILHEEVIAFMGVREQKNQLHISNLAVKQQFQHQGFGRSLIDYAKFLARRLELSALVLEVRASNKSAQLFYQKLGFVPAKLLKNYYVEIDEDGIEMIYYHD